MIFRRLGLAVLTVVALASCASDASTLSTQPTVAITTEVADSVVETTSAAPVKQDFGSAFIGAPTAFWFWAPY